MLSEDIFRIGSGGFPLEISWLPLPFCAVFFSKSNFGVSGLSAFDEGEMEEGVGGSERDLSR